MVAFLGSLKMLARVDSGIWLSRSDLTPKLAERLRLGLTFPNPAYMERLRLGLDPDCESEELCFLEEHERDLRLPRGAIHLLRQAAKQENIAFTFEDKRTLPDVPLAELPKLGLRDYQSAGVSKLVQHTQGIVVLPCGSGKLFLGLGAVAQLRTPSLVLVHTSDLAEQWISNVESQLGLKAGLIGGGTTSIEPITVALVQSLIRWDRQRLETLLGSFGLLILDEAHHCPSTIFREIVDASPSKYRLGLTATPEREDGLTPLLGFFIGPELLRKGHADLIKAGYLAVPEIRVVNTAFDYPYDGPWDYQPMLAALANDDDRNRLIADTIATEAQAGQVCLALSGRVDHCEEIHRRLTQLGISTELLIGNVPRHKRKALLDKARQGELSVLVATSLADEGLDIPRLSRVFLTFPSRARGRTIQRL